MLRVKRILTQYAEESIINYNAAGFKDCMLYICVHILLVMSELYTFGGKRHNKKPLPMTSRVNVALSPPILFAAEQTYFPASLLDTSGMTSLLLSEL